MRGHDKDHAEEHEGDEEPAKVGKNELACGGRAGESEAEGVAKQRESCSITPSVDVSLMA
ncbi:hypothetical protein QFC19_001815 [Naganishia cerealis]|uniref:Uncharacterized protein n=1 Tax=Naganishia cerealis TaxID=610337 RepID=A0ACC2WEJ1_9TREE|nr:hypothetical protein QFC19_001815 [Naganishia cerealis]